MFKKVPAEIKTEIINKVKSGLPVAEAASQYGISSKTIYTWLSNQIKPEYSILEINRLKRENDELKRIIGIITLDLERGKKNRRH
jgi:transposase-like protein